MGMALGGGGGVRSDINVTPLVDVVLVLLIIFMVLTPLMEKEMAVRVPETADPEYLPETPPDEAPKQVVLTLKANGQMLLNKDYVTFDELPGRLSRAMRQIPNRLAFVGAEDDVSYEQLVAFIDLARSNGVATVGMLTEPPKDPAAEGEAGAEGAGGPAPEGGAPEGAAPEAPATP